MILIFNTNSVQGPKGDPGPNGVIGSVGKAGEDVSRKLTLRKSLCHESKVQMNKYHRQSVSSSCLMLP